MADHNQTDAVSRRNVLKATGGLLAGSTMLAGLGAGRGAAATEEGLQIEVREMTEEYIAVEVYSPTGSTWDGEPIFLGHAERFVIHEDEDAVSLPEDTEPLANPVEVERLDERTYGMYFRTPEVDLSEAEGEEVVMGLGVFEERTIPGTKWDIADAELPPLPY